ncbi:MAG: N-acetylmuramoyl-L-alanine amidase [Gemmatimonadota bacterium]|nr:N-acetylmuramoyl-L-alanine amidase [Gemmatimonadota bacterium]
MPAIAVPGTAEATRISLLPPVPFADRDLRLEVGYPPEGATLAVRDQNFLFGSTGSGRARLTVNGTPVEVAPNGGFLAFLPVPPDGVYRLVAERDSMTVTLDRTVRVPPGRPSLSEGLAIVPGSGYPSGAAAAAPGESIKVGFRGSPGADAWLVLSGGDRIRLVEAGALDLTAETGEPLTTPEPAVQPGGEAAVSYDGVLPAQAVAAADVGVSQPSVGTLPSGSERARFELALGADTVSTPLRLNLATLLPEQPRAAIASPPPGAASSWRVRGRNDVAGPYHYFWPAGTLLRITGERRGMLRVGLAPGRSAWVPAGEVRLLTKGTPPPGGFVADVRFDPGPEHIDVRVPIPERLPFQVVAEERVLHLDIFGATSRTNFFHYGRMDPLIERAEWSQPSDQVYRVSVWLRVPVWGYEAFFDSGAAVLRIRRPPQIDPSAPLRGLRVVVDPGHGGVYRDTRGPTGLTEADANLAVSLALRELLEERGADVVLTRTGDETVELADRPRIATEADGDLLVSVHNNAFPDGVDPWANHGTSVYYFHPPSAELAQLLQRTLLEALGTRDLGIGRADLALVRSSWMPSILSEALFMMVPEHEAALRAPAVQRRIALAHVRALEAFAARRAAVPGD